MISTPVNDMVFYLVFILLGYKHIIYQFHSLLVNDAEPGRDQRSIGVELFKLPAV